MENSQDHRIFFWKMKELIIQMNDKYIKTYNKMAFTKV